MKSNWFIATLILQCEIAGNPSLPGEWTCSQQIFLIQAIDREIAYDKAMNFGKSQEVSYPNAEGEEVAWKFVGLENLELLPDNIIQDGTEIWGRIFHSNDPHALVVEQEGLSVYYEDEIMDIKAEEIINNGPSTKLLCNRVRS